MRSKIKNKQTGEKHTSKTYEKSSNGKYMKKFLEIYERKQ